MSLHIMLKDDPRMTLIPSLELKRQTFHRISSASPLIYLQSDETIGGYDLLKLENKPKKRKNKILEIGNPIRKKKENKIPRMTVKESSRIRAAKQM